MSKEFYLVPSKDYKKLLNNNNVCKTENDITSKNNNYEKNNIHEDPEVLLKLYDRNNKIEQNKNIAKSIESNFPESDVNFQRSDGIKLIKFLNDKRLIDIDRDGVIRVPKSSDTISSYIYKDKIKMAYPEENIEHKSSPKMKYIPVFSENTPMEIRSDGIELINSLYEKNIITIDENGNLRLPNSEEKIPLDNFLRSVFVPNTAIKKYVDFLRHVVHNIPEKIILNDKLKSIITLGGKKQNINKMRKSVSSTRFTKNKKLSSKVKTENKTKNDLPLWIYL